MSHSASRRNRSQGNSVSLFPFLAVLICAMGALIFLLLVLTQKIRRDQLETLTEAPPPVVTTTVRLTVPPQLPLIALSESAIAFTPQPLPAPKPQSVPVRLREGNPRVGRQLIAARVPERVPLPKPIDPNGVLREELRTVQDAENSLRKTTVEESKTLQNRIANRDELQTELNGIRDERKTLTQTVREQAVKGRELLTAREQLTTELRQLSQRGQKLVHQPKASSRFRVVAFDGQLGTTRRPIYIECTAKELRFLSEEIALGPRDLTGHGPLQNPFRAGVEAAANYWLKTEPNANAPYVLLIVRPGGTVAFYTARQLLSGYRLPFGYELVDDNVDLEIPAAPADLTKAVQAAIDAARRRRRGTLVAGGFGPGNGGTGVSGRGAASQRLPAEKPLGSGNASRPGQGTGSQEERGTGRFRRGKHGVLVYEPEGKSLPGEKPLPSSPWDGIDQKPTGDPKPAGTRRGSQAPPFPSPERSGSPNRGGTPGRNGTSDGRAAPRPFSGLAGQQGGAGSQMTNGGGSQQAPPGQSIANPNRSTNGKRKLWGQSQSRAGIGIERTISVRIDGTTVRIGQQQPFDLAAVAAADLMQRIEQELNSEATTWGAPPPDFFWLPRVQFSVDGAGLPHANGLLKPLRENYGIASKIDIRQEGGN